MKKLKLIYIEWEDAVSNDGTFRVNEAAKWGTDNTLIICEAGWLLDETDDYLLIATDYWLPCGYDPPVFKKISRIPKSLIRKRKVLMTVDI